MQEDHILLDTNVLSHARKTRPPPQIKEFMSRLREGFVAIATTSIFELERGAMELMPHDPERALELIGWIEGLLAKDIYLLPINAPVSRLIARMSLCGPLRDFWIKHPNSDKLKFGSDPNIAAVSIVHQIPIATSDIGDYLRIHAHFPLPGLYDPMEDRWHIQPPPGWFVLPAANDSRLRSDGRFRQERNALRK